MTTNWHAARNRCAGTAAHSTRLHQQRRQRRGTAAHSTGLLQQRQQHRGTAAALDSFLAVLERSVLSARMAMLTTRVAISAYKRGAPEQPRTGAQRRRPN